MDAVYEVYKLRLLHIPEFVYILIDTMCRSHSNTDLARHRSHMEQMVFKRSWKKVGLAKALWDVRYPTGWWFSLQTSRGDNGFHKQQTTTAPCGLILYIVISSVNWRCLSPWSRSGRVKCIKIIIDFLLFFWGFFYCPTLMSNALCTHAQGGVRTRTHTRLQVPLHL